MVCRLIVMAVVMCVLSATALAQDRQDVTFSITQTTGSGQSVFVTGSLPELGGGDIRFAVKLESKSYPLWKATISLPVNTSYTYRYVLRNDAAGQWGNASNFTNLTSVQSASTNTVTLTPTSKTVFYHSTMTSPTLWWRPAGSGGSYQTIAMHDSGPGRSEFDRRWAARRFGMPRQSIEFYFTNATQTQRDPASGVYTTALDWALVQTSQVYNYIPAASVTGPARQFNPTSPPGIQSIAGNLNELRRYRVILPRGYSQHPTRRYPVLYLHDGQNCFDASTAAFGVEWQADESSLDLTRQGQMRETILVGVDNGPNRLNDYAAPDAGGWADRYARFLRDELKPVIDATYRTLTGPDDTGTLGSSMGGQVSLYLGWDFTATFRKIGAFSGAWNVFNNGFTTRVQSQALPNIRLYMDSGDSGTSSDNFWVTLNLRDNFIDPARVGGNPYVLEGDLRYTYGPGQIHNEAAWASRLPGCLRFLFPISDEPNLLVNIPSARPGDVSDDDVINVDDLYAFEQGTPGAASSTDVDRNGVGGEAGDRAALLGLLRSVEAIDAGTRE